MKLKAYHIWFFAMIGGVIAGIMGDDSFSINERIIAYLAYIFVLGGIGLGIYYFIVYLYRKIKKIVKKS